MSKFVKQISNEWTRSEAKSGQRDLLNLRPSTMQHHSDKRQWTFSCVHNLGTPTKYDLCYEYVVLRLSFHSMWNITRHRVPGPRNDKSTVPHYVGGASRAKRGRTVRGTSASTRKHQHKCVRPCSGAIHWNKRTRHSSFRAQRRMAYSLKHPITTGQGPLLAGHRPGDSRPI